MFPESIDLERYSASRAMPPLPISGHGACSRAARAKSPHDSWFCRCVQSQIRSTGGCGTFEEHEIASVMDRQVQWASE
jgi:hypothetical protein